LKRVLPHVQAAEMGFSAKSATGREQSQVQ